MELSERIRRAREAAGLTQAQLAEQVGVDPKTVRNWEAGRVPRRSLGGIERVLGIDLTSDQRDAGPTLDEASDAQVLANVASRLASRDATIRDLQEKLRNALEGQAPTPGGARWAARQRTRDDDES